MKVQKYCMQFTPIMLWQTLENQQCNKAHTLGSQKTDMYYMEAVMEILFLFIQLYTVPRSFRLKQLLWQRIKQLIYYMKPRQHETHAHPSAIHIDSY